MSNSKNFANPASKRATRFALSNCSRKCSLNPNNLPGTTGALIHGWYEDGNNDNTILEKAKVIGVKLSTGSIGRHRANHLTRLDQVGVDPSFGETGERKTDLEVLEIMIGRGAQQVELSTSKISAEQLLRAIELKHRLTEGSVFESLFGALVEEGDEAYSAAVDPAEKSEDEAAQAAPIDVEVPQEQVG